MDFNITLYFAIDSFYFELKIKTLIANNLLITYSNTYGCKLSNFKEILKKVSCFDPNLFNFLQKERK